MKASKFKIQTIFTLSILVIALSSCEKDDKLEQPQDLLTAEIHSEQFTLNQDSTGLTMNRPESLPPEGMYLNTVYSKVKPAAIFQYGSYAENKVEFFQAVGNHVSNRPLILLGPGGAWQSYTEQAKLRELAHDLALRGYAVGLIEYYIKANTPPSFDTQLKSMHDFRSAVRYFKLNADKYRIDPENIFMGGWSTGAVMSLAGAYIEDVNELQEITDTLFRDAFVQSVNNLGFDNADNPGVSSDVRGVLAMFGWSLQKTFIDAGEPALMMINHAAAHFTDGTNIIGTISYNGGTVYGTDPMNTRAMNEGFVQGQDLEYIRMNGPSPYKGANEACLWDGNYNAIADFFHRNLKK